MVPRGTAGTATGYGVVNLTEKPRRITIPKRGFNRLSGEMVEEDVLLEPLEVMLIDVCHTT